jgi:hypothetical protein
MELKDDLIRERRPLLLEEEEEDDDSELTESESDSGMRASPLLKAARRGCWEGDAPVGLEERCAGYSVLLEVLRRCRLQELCCLQLFESCGSLLRWVGRNRFGAVQYQRPGGGCKC